MGRCYHGATIVYTYIRTAAVTVPCMRVVPPKKNLSQPKGKGPPKIGSWFWLPSQFQIWNILIAIPNQPRFSFHLCYCYGVPLSFFPFWCRNSTICSSFPGKNHEKTLWLFHIWSSLPQDQTPSDSQELLRTTFAIPSRPGSATRGLIIQVDRYMIYRHILYII